MPKAWLTTFHLLVITPFPSWTLPVLSPDWSLSPHPSRPGCLPAAVILQVASFQGDHPCILPRPREPIPIRASLNPKLRSLLHPETADQDKLPVISQMPVIVQHCGDHAACRTSSCLCIFWALATFHDRGIDCCSFQSPKALKIAVWPNLGFKITKILRS